MRFVIIEVRARAMRRIVIIDAMPQTVEESFPKARLFDDFSRGIIRFVGMHVT